MIDPRASLAALAAILCGTLFGGNAGLLLGGMVALAWTAAAPHAHRSIGPLLAVVPIALLVAVLDALAGRTAEGAAAAVRLTEVTAITLAFARASDARALADGLRALHVPYAAVFVLAAGARFVPVTAGDLGELLDAARLRGLGVDGGPLGRLAAWRVLLVPLLVVTIRRGLQLGEAMEARGFATAARRTVRTTLVWRGADTAVVLLALAYLAAVALLRSRVG